MNSKADILARLEAAKPLLISQFPIRSIALFGSAARGDINSESDIDILIEFNGSIGSRFFEVARELENFLQNKVDLVSRKGVKQKYFDAIKPDLIYV